MIDWFLKKFLSAPAYVLWCALENPPDWISTGNKIRHVPSSQCFWVAAGAFFFDGYDDTPKFLGWIDRHIVWRRVVTMRGRQVMLRMLKMTETKP